MPQRPARFRGCPQPDELKLIAEVEAGQQPDQGIMKADSITSDNIADGWQNLLRWAGNLPAAKKFAEQWQAARGDSSALPALRLGEIDFLTHQYNDAATEFGLAARRWLLVNYNDALDPDQAELDRGTALLAVGRTVEAVQTLRPLDQEGTLGYSYENSPNVRNLDAALQFAAVSYYACEQLADYESESGNLYAAVEDYTNALDWVRLLQEGGARAEALNNNAVIAYLSLGDTSTAAMLESNALATDAQDPVFLMTAGSIADRAGRVAQAAQYDREALDSDPGAFLAVGARVLVARSKNIAITHESWPPALAFGLLTGAAGLPWAPLPVVRADGKDGAKVHLAAPITLAALSALLFVESVWLHTPIAESWAIAALIMSASTLLPVGPLDGAQLGKAGVLAAAGVVGGALLVGLGLI